MTAVGDHWLDRLARRMSRREALKLAAASGTMLVVTRPPRARAAATDLCQKGCLVQNQATAKAKLDVCRKISDRESIETLIGGLLFAPLLIQSTVSAGVGLARLNSCVDTALLERKAQAWDCLQPNCPGFDPHAPGGPCDTCLTNVCCPDPKSQDGYSCCVACASAGGCCASANGNC